MKTTMISLMALAAGLAMNDAARAADPAVTHAIAVLAPTEGSGCKGIVRFTQEGNSVKVVADVEGLPPNAKNAIHIHECGDCSAPDATSAGGHYNPENNPHGLPNVAKHHAGDMGNIESDATGKAHYELTLTGVTIMGDHDPIIGRSVIVHRKMDDGGQPTGNAGPRIACGVIGVAR